MDPLDVSLLSRRPRIRQDVRVANETAVSPLLLGQLRHSLKTADSSSRVEGAMHASMMSFSPGRSMKCQYSLSGTGRVPILYMLDGKDSSDISATRTGQGWPITPTSTACRKILELGMADRRTKLYRRAALRRGAVGRSSSGKFDRRR